MIKSYRDLDVWRSGMDFAAECYRLAKLMPGAEEFRITSQLLRAAASVPANIAEGWMRASRKDYARFVSIARGSLAEAETFLLLSVRASYRNRRRLQRWQSLTNWAVSSTRTGANSQKLPALKPQSPTPKPIGTAGRHH